MRPADTLVIARLLPSHKIGKFSVTTRSSRARTLMWSAHCIFNLTAKLLSSPALWPELDWQLPAAWRSKLQMSFFAGALSKSLKTRRGKVTSVVADPTTEAGARVIGRTVPHADIIIDNLGIYESKDFNSITDDDWLRFFKVNVLSGVHLTSYYLNGMLRRNWGRIIFISSDSALIVPPDVIHYGMSKAAQLAVSRGFAAATKRSGVTVNSILPGTTRSAGIEGFLRSVSGDPTLTLERIEQEYFEKNDLRL
jgi:NAD(P)-dependent dehydrogenase (short-subunit alcohol dehydrogenase family)